MTRRPNIREIQTATCNYALIQKNMYKNTTSCYEFSKLEM